MRFVFVLVLIVAAVAAFGFYRGWFRVSSDDTAGKSNVTFTVDKDKMQQDKADAQEKMHRTEDKPAVPAANVQE